LRHNFRRNPEAMPAVDSIFAELRRDFGVRMPAENIFAAGKIITGLLKFLSRTQTKTAPFSLLICPKTAARRTNPAK